MESYLLAYDLWASVEEDNIRVPLLEDSILTQIPQYAERSMKNFKVLSILHLSISEDIFPRLVGFRMAKKA